MSIEERLTTILKEVPPKVKLIAVSKTQPVDALLAVYRVGQRMFGENKAQELLQKAPNMPGDVEWHFIGHLQTNKVRSIIPYVHTIHSIDSFRLLKMVHDEAARANRTIHCLLQIYIATEETKFGLSEIEAIDIVKRYKQEQFQHVKVVGLMGMASFSEEEQLIRSEFRAIKKLFNQMKEVYFNDDPWFKELSIGMTSDFKIAIEEGSTMVRVGTAIFGERQYITG